MLYCDFVAKLWMKLHTPRLHIQRNGIYVFGCFTVLLIKLYDTTGKIKLYIVDFQLMYYQFIIFLIKGMVCLRLRDYGNHWVEMGINSIYKEIRAKFRAYICYNVFAYWKEFFLKIYIKVAS